MEGTAMDTQQFEADFSFAFKRRSNSPSPYECLAPASLHTTTASDSSLSPPPSLSDSTSQASHGSPRDWSMNSSSFAWMNGGWSQPGLQPQDQTAPWSWGHILTSPVATKQEPAFGSHSIDPTVLAFDESFLSSHPAQLLPSPAFSNDLFGLAGLPPQVPAPPPSFHPAPMMMMPESAQAGDFDLIMSAIQAAGVHTAALPASPEALVVGAMPEKTAAPPLPKPDLAACPPLAKHLMQSQPQSRSSLTPSGSSTTSPSQPADDLPAVVGPSGRPKTSHTTIERRYRTNLNARILSLRHAVPALRVLEKDETTGRPKFPDDVVDARGFVDGVRVARKASKASILGKAAEYIHVLKKRELRLKHEAAGLKMLVNSLAGGPALLREFEARWKKQYGGEEKDEVELEAGSDAEDGEDESDDDEKPRKRAKVASAPAAKKEKVLKTEDAGVGGGEIGKRKRGRPKKVQPTAAVESVPTSPSTTNTDAMMASPSSASSHQPGGVQYMLGAFLFFSFFRNGGNNNSAAHHADPNHHHTGTVLLSSRLPTMPMAQVSNHQNIQVLVALLLLVSIIYPLLPSLRRKKRTDSEVEKMKRSLGVGGVVTEVGRCVVRGFPARSLRGCDASSHATAAWEKLCFAELSSGSTSSVSTILSLYRHLPKTPDASTALALTAYLVSPLVATSLWSSAASNGVKNAKVAHAMVFRMPIGEAYNVLQRSLSRNPLPSKSTSSKSVVDIVAETIVVDAVHGIARDSFLRTSTALSRSAEDGADGEWEDPMMDADIKEASQWIVAVGAGLPLAHAWSRVCQGGDAGAGDGHHQDTWDLLHALVLLRRAVPHQVATGLSTPSSSSTTTLVLENNATASKSTKRGAGGGGLLKLRQVLASPVFVADEELEDARDAVVDCLIYGAGARRDW